MKHKRVARRYFVRRRFQGWFIAVFCILVCAGGAAAAAVTGFAAHEALGRAMFRSHYFEQSTGDIVMPVLVKVNAIAALVVIVGEAALAAWFFSRASKAVDTLCARFAQWRGHVEQDTVGAMQGGPEIAADTQAHGWVGDLEQAICYAEAALHSTYHDAAVAAEQAAAVADRIHAGLSSSEACTTLDPDLDALTRRLADVDERLAQHTREDNA